MYEGVKVTSKDRPARFSGGGSGRCTVSVETPAPRLGRASTCFRFRLSKRRDATAPAASSSCFEQQPHSAAASLLSLRKRHLLRPRDTNSNLRTSSRRGPRSNGVQRPKPRLPTTHSAASPHARQQRHARAARHTERRQRCLHLARPNTARQP